MTFMEIVWNNPASRRTKTFVTRFTIPPILAGKWRDSSLPTWVPENLPFYPRTKRSMRLRDTGWSLKFFTSATTSRRMKATLTRVMSRFFHRQANVPQNLKRMVKGTDGKLPLALYATDPAPEIETEKTDFGIRIFSIRKTEEGRTFFRVTNFILPNLATIPGPMSGDGYNLYWHVPNRRYSPLALRHCFSSQRSDG